MAKKLLLVGWDAADWRVIHPLIDRGEMPAMERIVSGGVIGNLATLHPILSPMLWTSIATGKRPFRHGVLGFTEPTPDGQGIRPVSGASRKGKAIWNILSQQQMRCHVVGWWPTHPVESINGAMVSNHYQRAVAPLDDPWPLAPGTIHPPRLAETLAELRFHPHELCADQVKPFLPKLDEIDPGKDPRLASLLKILAECTSVHGAATWLIDNEPWDFMAVYYDAIDHFCHGFMKYHPPRRPAVSEKDFELYKGVVEAGYRYHDMMLQTLLQKAGPDTTVIVVSDHGFHPDHRRPDSIPSEPAGPAVEHRDFGVIAMMGPGIKQDVQVYGATLLDVTPTILAALGLPLGEDMDGKALVDVFEEPPDGTSIPSWDAVEGDAGMHPEDVALDPLESQEAVDQLVALGYVDKPDDDREKAVARTTAELRYNLARSYMDGQRHGDALEILEELFAANPAEYRYGAHLALCYRAENRIPEMRSLVEDMNHRRTRDANEARVKLQEWQAIVDQRKRQRDEGKAPASEGNAPLLDEKERREVGELQTQAHLDVRGLEYFMGYVEMADGNHEKALQYLERAAQAEPRRVGLLLQIGEAYLQLRLWGDAERAFERAAAVDVENAYVQTGLARAALGQRRNRVAAQLALTSIGLLYQQPQAHFVLGIALHRMGRIPASVQALAVATSLNPNFVEAYERLADIYERRLDNREKAAAYRMIAGEIRTGVREPTPRGALVEGPDRPVADSVTAKVKAQEEILPDDAGPFVTVVSGLPRSGTSMMMRMLESAGVPVLTDGVRLADEDNPRGYFELENVKRTRQDSRWVEEADGKAVKMTHLLLPQLPPRKRYRVIMMRRDLDEVVRSQAQMLERRKPRARRPDPVGMKRAYARQLARIDGFLLRHPSFVSIDVNYNEILEGSLAELGRIKSFLGLSRPMEALSQVVEPDLYRQRRSAE